MDPILSHARARQGEIIALIRRMVECESPSDDARAVDRFVDLLAAQVAPLAAVKTFPGGGRFGRHLFCEFSLPGKKKQGEVLALGHSDTVWPLGTLAGIPFREADSRLWGPGVLDMKSAITMMMFALQALKEAGTEHRPVTIFLDTDEEVGSESSRPITEAIARQCEAVLVLEPAQGVQGLLKTARKGVGVYTVRVHGLASHAGVDFEKGHNAVVELSHQILEIVKFTDLSRGITVNPGVVQGGTRSNVIAAEATAEVDVRITQMADADYLVGKFYGLHPLNPHCKLEVTGGVNRPPMERTEGTVGLLQIAQGVARELGMELGESRTGGGSDGNFTSALGIPTLDGLGGVGEGAHSLHESIILKELPLRTALLAGLIQRI